MVEIEISPELTCNEIVPLQSLRASDPKIEYRQPVSAFTEVFPAAICTKSEFLATSFCATPCCSHFNFSKTFNKSTTAPEAFTVSRRIFGEGYCSRGTLAPRVIAFKKSEPNFPFAAFSEKPRMRPSCAVLLGQDDATSSSDSSFINLCRGILSWRAHVSLTAATSRSTARVLGFALRDFILSHAFSGLRVYKSVLHKFSVSSLTQLVRPVSKSVFCNSSYILGKWATSERAYDSCRFSNGRLDQFENREDLSNRAPASCLARVS